MKLKKCLIWLLCICFLIVPIEYQVSAANGVETKIAEVLQKYPSGSYFSANGNACGHTQGGGCSNCRLSSISSSAANTCGDAYTCVAFAKYVYWYIFGVKYKNQPCKTASIDTINSIAKVGDYIEFFNASGSNYHDAIYLGASANGFYTYDANIGVANKVVYNFERTKSNNNYATSTYKVYHASNYDNINSASSSSSVTITSLPDENTITDTNAILWARVDKASSAAVSKIGIRIRKDGDTYSNGWSRYDTPSKNYVDYSYMYIYYDMSAELGLTLTHATKYWIQFYVKVNGTEYWGNEEYFTTTGSHSYTIYEHEAAHPHKYYKKCSCGDYYYTGETSTMDGCSYCSLKLTVKYDANGGYINSEKSSTYSLNSSELIYRVSGGDYYTTTMTYGISHANGFVNASTLGLVRDGYSFKGWSLFSSGGTVYSQTGARYPEDIYPDLVNGSATITMYAVWEPYQLTIKYHSNGGYIKEEKADANYLDSDGLVRKVSTDSYYSSNWKYGTTYSQGLIDDTTFGIVKDGYSFVGWSLSADGGTVYDKTTSRNPEDIYHDLVNGNSAIILYAMWEKCIVTGDIDEDGILNAKDVVLLRKRLLNSGKLDYDEKYDVNFDDEINVIDLVKMKKLAIE